MKTIFLYLVIAFSVWVGGCAHHPPQIIEWPKTQEELKKEMLQRRLLREQLKAEQIRVELLKPKQNGWRVGTREDEK